ncbi:hypothetical protein SK128_014350 [Halocaridina rubra]|uniref:Uncharacterized protein n=1 Tax=Halocaridina rubra TaxID=373956 RepID=A0AAN9A6Y4_HALRR
MNLGSTTFLLVVEHQVPHTPGKLRVYGHDVSTDKMVLVTIVELWGGDDVDAITEGNGALIAVTSRASTLTNATVSIFTASFNNQILIIEALQTIHVSEAYHCSFSVMPSGEIGLFIQTLNRIHLYLWKCVKFLYARQIITPGAVWPSSEAFLYGDPGVLLIPFSGYGSWDPFSKEHTLYVLNSTLYTAIYRGDTVILPSYLL